MTVGAAVSGLDAAQVQQSAALTPEPPELPYARAEHRKTPPIIFHLSVAGASQFWYLVMKYTPPVQAKTSWEPL